MHKETAGAAAAAASRKKGEQAIISVCKIVALHNPNFVATLEALALAAAILRLIDIHLQLWEGQLSNSQGLFRLKMRPIDW